MHVSYPELGGLRGDAASLDFATGVLEADWLDPLSTTAAAWLDPFSLETRAHGCRSRRKTSAPRQIRTDLVRLEASGNAALTLSPHSLPPARIQRAYRAALTAAGASRTYRFAVSAGSLPPGLSLNPATGVLSGTPTRACTLTFRITATDGTTPPLTGSQSYTLIVKPARSLIPIQGTHPRWLAAVFLLALLTIGLYVVLPPGRSANLRPRLIFAVEGSGMLLFCSFLPARKRLLRMPYCGRWRILRTSFWETGHFYLGLLSCLVIHCHAGFRMGGPLTSALLVVLWGTLGSGLSALLFRQLLVLTKAGKEGKGLMAARIIAAGHFLSHRLHAPLTVTLFVMAAAHAVMALFY
jgi:hypothetical protein